MFENIIELMQQNKGIIINSTLTHNNMSINFTWVNNFKEIGYGNKFRLSLVGKRVFNNTEFYCICVDNEFMQLENNIQEFLLLHEIGHIVNNHVENRNELFNKIRIITGLSVAEIIADKVAIDSLKINEGILLTIMNKIPNLNKIDLYWRYLMHKILRLLEEGRGIIC